MLGPNGAQSEARRGENVGGTTSMDGILSGFGWNVSDTSVLSSRLPRSHAALRRTTQDSADAATQGTEP